MSSFFSTPGSLKKRKRSEAATSTGGGKPKKPRESYKDKNAPEDDDISSGSESGDEGKNKKALSDDEGDEDEEFAGETAAEKRLRLAQQYLNNLREEADEVGFDAADIDRDIIAERLKESVAEEKGKIYRHISSQLSFATADSTLFRMDTGPTTGIATCSPYIYTVAKDGFLTKWELPVYPHPPSTGTNHTVSKKPKRIKYVRACRKENAQDFQGHAGPILCVAASQDGKFVATGGQDTRIVVWDAELMKALKVFKFHRGAVTGLTFRRGSNQLYSCSTDRSVKLWSLDELAYVESLFGHQDEVVGITALAGERCVTVGSRDRTARLWKIVEETQLVFRGGGRSSGTESRKPRKNKDGSKRYEEGTIDCVAMIDEEHFVTGSDNGDISLWSILKKKPVHTIQLAHGLQRTLLPDEHTAESSPTDPPPEPCPRYITALAAVPYSDLILSGSWDNQIRAWKVSSDKRRLEPLGTLGPSDKDAIRGVVNGISIIERGEKGKEVLAVCVGIGKELRLGKWLRVEGRNGGYVIEVDRKEVEKPALIEPAEVDKISEDEKED
ncbi:WD40 repeat-like protein [Choiromyces venosus 120613-1]|uniref:WD40 repeat-like protein n=1 Tax=Choiromyces venosus 120613-1 TaxID=1336337 RepID=A0A3N4JHX6_9PEZI|nr:WD40 repeat-like protein [Choiromyces venosus 120613-1]